MNDNELRSRGLKPTFTPLMMWAFSIGTSIGWGSFIVTCNSLLQNSGVLGTVYGLLIGMAVILVITWNLQYMIRKAPSAGGVYTFEKQIGGRDLGFLSFWFVLLTYLAVLWANITSVPLFARFFLGNTFRFGFRYSIFGYEVWLGEALLSVAAVALIGLFCARSPKSPGRVMVGAALTFAVGFTACAIFAWLKHDSLFSYSPLYIEGSGAFSQIIRTAAISPWAFIGFENISHFSEEYTFPLKRTRRILIWSVVITTLLYIFVSLLSVSAYPPEYDSWLAYIRDMGNLDGIKAVPAFYAAEHYLGRGGVAVLMLALFAVILTSLIGNMLALSRLLYAAGREGEAPAALAKLNDRGIPDRAAWAVVLLSVWIPFLGRTAIGWIVDVTTLGSTLIYALLSFAVYRFARREHDRAEAFTGMTGLALMAVFLMLFLIPGLLPFHAMATESYMLFIVWAVLGLAYFRRLLRKDQTGEHRQRIFVWIILLMLVLFASTMWVSRETEKAADSAVENIHAYQESHPAELTDDAEQLAFLREQAAGISSTNTLYTSASLGLLLLSIIIMLDNYRDNLVLGRRLSDAQDQARAAQKIAELKVSISALLDNMPCLSFSKDAETGVYLACNQAFAEYAHKADPSGVVGLTDAEIFDPLTASHFVEDDKMALSMDGAYIFFEDVPDAAGNPRQFQTTKLKYIDDAGRLCTLGMCQDVTDMVRIQRENATTKEAYERARSTGIIYTHIAQTLAKGYIDLYYVNLDTEEYIEYVPDDQSGRLREVRRGWHFFDQCRVEAEMYIYPDDRETFVAALDRRTLLEKLNRSNSVMLSYRLMSEKGGTYVNLKVSRMVDDDRFIILGTMNVDEQIRQRQATERMREERRVYARLNALTGAFLRVYIVDEETGRFREYSASDGSESLDLPREGMDLFAVMRREVPRFIHADDLDRFLSLFTGENVLEEVDRGGVYALTVRILMEKKPTYIQIRVARVVEKEGRRLVVGITDIDDNVRQEEEYARRLAQAQSKANIDALTGVKNKHAYLEAEDGLNQQIAEHREAEFAIIVLDVNDLKKVNDRLGHKAGDQYLRDACGIICNIFKRSPVFRVGGDEFAVISQGVDYASIEELIGRVADHNSEAILYDGIIIACGMAKYEKGMTVADVFEEADRHMYENKELLKAGKAVRQPPQPR